MLGFPLLWKKCILAYANNVDDISFLMTYLQPLNPKPFCGGFENVIDFYFSFFYIKDMWLVWQILQVDWMNDEFLFLKCVVYNKHIMWSNNSWWTLFRN